MSVEGNIYEKGTQRPIPYATIHAMKNNKIVDCNEHGSFVIEVMTGDTLEISSVGFISQKLAVDNIGNEKIFSLSPQIDKLKEVVVRNEKPIDIGWIDKKQERSFAGSLKPDRFEIATMIQTPGQLFYRVNKVFIKEKRFSEEMPFQLHLYSVDIDGLPKNELLKKEIIIDGKNYKNNLLTIELEDQNIILEDSIFFVSVQWMTSATSIVQKRGDYGIGETYKIDKTLTYRRSLSLASYRWFSEYENGFFIPKQNNKETETLLWNGKEGKSLGKPINMLVSVEVQAL